MTLAGGEKMTTEKMPAKTLLTIEEASALTAIPRSTLYSWYESGCVGGVNIGGRCLRIFAKSLEAFLMSRTGRGKDGLPSPAENARPVDGRTRRNESDK
jgi:excisionase family DNA binding protein